MNKKRDAVQKHFEISNYEQKVLNEITRKTGQKESHVFRDLLKGYEPMEAPGDNFYRAIEEIRRVGENINQIAKVANSVGYIDEKYLLECKKELDELIVFLKKAVLQPHKRRDAIEIINSLEFLILPDGVPQEDAWRIQNELKRLWGIKIDRREVIRYGDDEDLANSPRLEYKAGN